MQALLEQQPMLSSTILTQIILSRVSETTGHLVAPILRWSEFLDPDQRHFAADPYGGGTLFFMLKSLTVLPALLWKVEKLSHQKKLTNV